MLSGRERRREFRAYGFRVEGFKLQGLLAMIKIGMKLLWLAVGFQRYLSYGLALCLELVGSVAGQSGQSRSRTSLLCRAAGMSISISVYILNSLSRASRICRRSYGST